jgi:hypothetical protein
MSHILISPDDPWEFMTRDIRSWLGRLRQLAVAGDYYSHERTVERIEDRLNQLEARLRAGRAEADTSARP